MDKVAQLADVAGPGIVAQPVLGRDSEAAQRQPLLVDQPVDVVAQEFRHVLRVLAQGRHTERDHAQLGKEIPPERLGAAGIEAGLGGSHQAHAQWPVCRSADRPVATGLQVRGEYALHPRAQVLETVDEQRAAVGAMVGARLDGTVALDAAQPFGGGLFVQSAGVDGDELAAGTRPDAVRVTGKGCAPGTGLADQQQGRLARCDLHELVAQVLHHAALADRHQERRHQRARRLARLASRGQRVVDDFQQLGQRQRLFDEVERAEPGSLHGRLDRAVTRHHDHRTRQRALR